MALQAHTSGSLPPSFFHIFLSPLSLFLQDIFGFIEIAPESFEFTVQISYFEIYMEKIRDLLCDGNDNLQVGAVTVSM